MATKIIKTEFQFKRGLSEAWAQKNPILRIGEPGFEYDTYKFKIGDGVKAWNDLPYIGSYGGTTPDGKSIILDGQILKLNGFEEAEANCIPIKDENGELGWIQFSTPQSITEEEIREICK